MSNRPNLPENTGKDHFPEIARQVNSNSGHFCRSRRRPI